jgi:16S rRNA (cytidine1402-2'-O)-methyltransferase
VSDVHANPALTGTLLLVPNALDLGTAPGDLREVLPDGVIAQAARLTHWVVEDARSARAFLKRVGALHPLALPLQQTDVRELPRPRKGSGETVPEREWDALLRPARQGQDVGLLSEAGLPAVADPGAALVAAAHRAGIPVRALAGPSAIVLALAASGLQGQCFAFVGYLPQEAPARAARLRELETLSRRHGQTQVFIETPYRNAAMLQALLATLAPSTRLSISFGLTLPAGTSLTDTVVGWRARAADGGTPWPAAQAGLPAVFALLA